MGVHFRSDCWCPFENRFYECHSVLDALRTMREWALPLQTAERHLLVAELEGVQFMGDEDPKFLFARISRLETTMRAVGITKRESDIVQIILHQLPERYNVVKIMTLADPQLTRSRLEYTIRSAYSQRKAHEITKQGPAMYAPAEPPNPHAFVVDHIVGDRGAGGGGGQRRDDGMISRGVGMPRQQQQQHWSRAVACHGSSSNGLAAMVFLISINVAPILFLRRGRRDSSNRSNNRSSNRHGESLRSELAGSTTAGATPCTPRRTHLSRRAHRCVRCTAVVVAANTGTSPNTVLHRVGLRTLAAPAASMVTYGGTALSVAVGTLI